MSRQNHVRWMAFIAVAVGLATAVSTAGAARRGRSALDEGEREGRPPEVETVVLRFGHIPAESFLDTLKQLGRNPEVRQGLKQMPIAVNGPANAVVLIAPPRIADTLRRVADELDQPNEFRIHEREREAEEAALEAEREQRRRDLDREQAEFDFEMDRRRLALERQEAVARREREEAGRRFARPPAPPPPPRHRGDRGRPRWRPPCRCPHRGAPRCRDAEPGRRPGWRRPRGRAGRPETRRPGWRRRSEAERPRPPRPGLKGRKPPGPRGRRPAPMRGPLGRLLSPRGREAFDLSEGQVEQIGDLAGRVRQHMHEVWQGVRDRMRRAEPEDRKRLLRRMKEKVARRWADHRRRVMERLEEILRPDQRRRLKRWMQERGPRKRPGRHERGPTHPRRQGRHPGHKGRHRSACEGHLPPCRLL